MRRLSLYVALFAALAFVVVACTAEDEPGPGANPTPALDETEDPQVDGPDAVMTTPEPLDSNEPPVITLPEGAQQGGTLDVAFFRAPASPDGYQANGSYERFYIYLSNEPLLAIGRDEQYNPAESLAYDFEMLEGGQRLRLHLREGVQFHGDYGEMTADDVVWSIERWFVEGQMGCRACASMFDAVSGVEKVDDYTVDFTLDRVDANITAKMFERETFIHSPEHWESVGQDAHKGEPVATGPYEVVNWEPGTNIEYEAHEDWWGGDPMADVINVRTIVETRSRLAALQTGQVNIAFLQAEMVPQAQNDDGVNVWSSPSGWEAFVWNHGLPPLDDLRLRRALIKALDRDGINTSIYRGTMEILPGGQLHPDLPGGVLLEDLWEGEHLGYDPEAAAQLVEEVAEDKGLELPLQLRGACERRPDRQQLCETLQSVWGEIGVEFTFVTTPNVAASAEEMDKCNTHHQATGSPTLFPFNLEGNLISHSPGNYAEKCLGQSTQMSEEARAAQDRIDELLVEAAETVDEDERIAMYQEVQRIHMEHLFNGIPIQYRQNFYGCHVETTGGCDTVETDNPNRLAGFPRIGIDFWVKQ